jgi:GAF domain-containing protein
MPPSDDRAAFVPAPLHPYENERLIAVQEAAAYTLPGEDGPMESIARQAAAACQTPYAMVSLIDDSEQRFLSCVGFDREPVPRDETFCAYCMLQSEPMVVENALEDPRFQNNPRVLGGPQVRFYLGAPITDGGLPLGTVCVVDTHPREVTSKALLAVTRLADKAAAILQLRRMLTERNGPYAPSAYTPESMERLNNLLMPLVER